MAESTKVRLVRCPKCENLLPELADYSVYQCGGCGAVLRAKSKNRDMENSSEKSDDERVAEVVTKLPNSLENGIVASDAFDTEVKSNAGSLRCEEKDMEKGDIGSTDGCKNQSKATSGKRVVENGLHTNLNIDDVNNAVGKENTVLNSQTGCTSGSWRTGRMSSWQCADKGEMNGFRRLTRTGGENVRFSTSNYPDEGPSNYNSDCSFNYGAPLRNLDNRDGSNRVQYLEKDRAELIRKLDELKEQLSRSCGVANKPKDEAALNGKMAPPDPYCGSDTWFSGGSSASERTSVPFFNPNKHAAGPPYFNHHAELFPCSSGHEMGIHGFHPSMHKSDHVPRYRDALGSQMLGRAPNHFAGQYQQPPQKYFSGHYIDTNPDPFEPYPSSAATFHQPSCSCFHCYKKHHEVSASVPPTTYKRFPDVSNNPMMYHHEHPAAFGSQVNDSRAAIPTSLNFHVTQSHTRWPSDLSPEMGGFVRCRPRKVFVASSGRSCRPIAGGAPFLTCFNCFELLQLPKKVLLMSKNQQKIRCGACSTVINVAVENKKIVLSVNAEAMQIPASVDDSSNEMMKEITSYSRGHMNRIDGNFSSNDYDSSGYDFQTIDTDPIESSMGHVLNSMKPQEMQSFHSSSPTTSEDENSPDVLIAQREFNNSFHQPIKATLSPPPPGSPLQHNFDYSSNNHAVNRLGKGNQSGRSDQEKVITNRAATRQNSMKEASMLTEMEVSYNEYAQTGVSQDSGDASREENQSKGHKGGDSFFANIKKSFKDFSRFNQADDHGRGNVLVNGHLIQNRVVKKAEKLAGPISPGQYWYDFRAGFWGVMGGPGLGIIPPFIEEFNYPMAENCAGGNTGIFVNGRELHQKDLELLASRALPTHRGRSYIIEISGRVLDEDTGEELDSLGRLAPTVEKEKHGFGMKVPKTVA